MRMSFRCREWRKDERAAEVFCAGGTVAESFGVHALACLAGLDVCSGVSAPEQIGMVT